MTSSIAPTRKKASPPLAMSKDSQQQSEYTPALTERLLSSLLKVVVPSVEPTPLDKLLEGGSASNYRSGVSPHSYGQKPDGWETNIPDSGSLGRRNWPSPGVALPHYPRILPDRFSLNKSKGYFFGIWPPIRMELPDFIPNDRWDRVDGLITHLTKLLKPLGLQNDDEEFHDTFDTISNLQSPTEPRHISENTSLSQLAVALINKFVQTGFRRDLEEALRVGQLALSSDGNAGDEQAIVLLTVGTLLSQRFKFTKNVHDLHGAIKFFNEAIELSSDRANTLRRLECLVSRAITLTTYFCQAKKDEALKEALVATSDAMQELLQSPFHKDWFLALSTCSAILYGERFCKDPSLLDWIVLLESSIHIIADEGSSEISETFRDDAYKRQTLEKLGLQLSRFHIVIERLDNCRIPADCDVGIVSRFDATAGRVLAGLWEEYGKRIRKTNPAIALAEIVNGCTIQLRYDVYGDMPASDELPTNNELFYFGVSSIQFRFRLMNMAVQLPEKKTLDEPTLNALERNPKEGGSSLAADQLRDLSATYREKYNTSNNLDDLTQAIQYTEAALNGTSVGSTERPVILEELLGLCHIKSVVAPDDTVLHQVMDYSKLVLANTDLAEQARFSVVAILAAAARQSFVSRATSLLDFDNAIELVETTLKNGISANHDRLQVLIPADLPFTLAMCLKTRYQNTGEPKNLDDCIKMMELAMTFPDHKPRGKAGMLINYGLILRLRYQRTKSLEDLDRAIEVTKEGLQHIHAPVERLGPMNNLVLIFNDRYDRSQDPADLRHAIDYGEEGLAIVKSVGDGGSAGTIFLINLANALSLTGDPSDLDAAVDYGLEAVRSDPKRKAHQAGAMRNDLSEVLLRRYQQKRNADDLNLAIQYAEEALECIPATHPLRGELLLQLGACLYLQPHSEAILQRCLGVYQDAWNCKSTLPAKRVGAASHAAKFLLDASRIGDAARLLESAVGLMPELEARWTQRADRLTTTSSCLALPANAAMVALQAGDDPALALSLLETGRGRMLGSLMDFRSDVAASHSHEGTSSVELVRNFNRLRMKADAATSETETRELKGKMTMMLQDIRQRPGFENFMFPPTADDYMKLAAEAPIVVVTTSELVDPGVAIIVTASQIYSLPLANLTHQEMTTRMHEMSEHTTWGRRKVMAARNARMLAFLEWLWNVVVEPILRDMGFKTPVDDPEIPLPRVRWIGVGLLAMAPFHAAGRYLPDGTVGDETTISCVVSSYAPSLRTLLYSTERKQQKYLARRRDASVLMVQMSMTEGATPLVNVEEEVRTLTKIASSASMRTATLDAPTTSEVLKNLPLYNLVHFACNGVSAPEDPSESHLILSDGKLTVQEIMRTHAAAPDVAFLSACSTAKGNDARLVDESIHIAGAFLMIGFRQVVGTLWQTPDKACMEISNRFYAKLVGEEESQWNGSWKVAQALHYSVKEVRQLHPNQPLTWASFVTFGA